MSAVNKRPAARYEPVDQCIYCRNPDCELTDEHPIPFSLGGHLILPKASCKACQNKILYYEGVTARTTLGNLRMRYGFPTRRPKERPTHIEIGAFDLQGKKIRKKIPVSEYPVGAFLPHLGRAGYFLGADPKLNVLQDVPFGYPSDDLNEFMNKHNWDGVVNIKWMPLEFGRTIIEMCYAYAVAEFGLNSFEPVCIPHILCKDDNISCVFGQNGQNALLEGESKVWDISLMYLVEERGKILFFAHCSILPGMGAPIYEVVLGRISNQNQMNVFFERLQNGKITPLQANSETNIEKSYN